MCDELRESLALLPRRAEPRIRIAKPSKGRIKKFVSGRRASTGTLPVEGPAKNELCRTVMFSSLSPEPMVDERRLPDPSPGNDCNNVYVLVCPGVVQEGDILFPTKNIAAGDRQSGYGNLLRCKSCWRLASSDMRSGRGRLQEALTSDSTPCVDSGPLWLLLPSAARLESGNAALGLSQGELRPAVEQP
jgi:hypothetical protein